MMVCHISFDESYGIGTDCLVTVEISVVDNSRNLNASFFQSIERRMVWFMEPSRPLVTSTAG